MVRLGFNQLEGLRLAVQTTDYRNGAVLPVRSARLGGCAGGRAFLELGAGQAGAMEPIFGRHGLEIARVAPDLSGVPRCLVLEKPLGMAGPIR